MFKHSKISPYKFKKILRCFAEDQTVIKAAEITAMDRKTINRYYQRIRSILASVYSASPQIHIHEMQTNSDFPIFEISYKNGEIDVQPIFNPNKLDIWSIINKRDYCTALYNDSQKDKFLLKDFDIEYKEVEHGIIIERFWDYAKDRIGKFYGLKKDDFYIHLKESEFRFNHKENLYEELEFFIKQYSKL